MGISALFYGGLAAVVLFFGFMGKTFVTDYHDMSVKIERLEHAAELVDRRTDSYKRMIDRRDAAIEASACKAQIKIWLRNPDDIPKPFQPFKPGH